MCAVCVDFKDRDPDETKLNKHFIEGLDEEERLREPSPLRRQSLMLRDLVEARRRQEALREAASGEPNDYRVPPPPDARAPTPPEVGRWSISQNTLSSFNN